MGDTNGRTEETENKSRNRRGAMFCNTVRTRNIPDAKRIKNLLWGIKNLLWRLHRLRTRTRPGATLETQPRTRTPEDAMEEKA